MAHHPPRILKILTKIERDRALEARMKLAIAATHVLLGAVVFPVGRLMHLAVGLIVTVSDQVARTFPSARIARDRGPGTAQEIAFADKIVEIDRGVDDLVIFRELADALELERHLLGLEINIVTQH